MVRSILDDLGAEVTGIVSPVSICMALTVVLVRVLNPEGTADPNAVAIANIYYHEQVCDTLLWQAFSNQDWLCLVLVWLRAVPRCSSTRAYRVLCLELLN